MDTATDVKAEAEAEAEVGVEGALVTAGPGVGRGTAMTAEIEIITVQAGARHDTETNNLAPEHQDPGPDHEIEPACCWRSRHRKTTPKTATLQAYV